MQSLFFHVIKIKAKGNKRGSARRVSIDKFGHPLHANDLATEDAKIVSLDFFPI